MRVLLDEQLPQHLARELTGHTVRTVQQEGWAGLKNGELLRRAASAAFDVFVTADQNLQFQQSLTGARLGVVVLAARSTALEVLRPQLTAGTFGIQGLMDHEEAGPLLRSHLETWRRRSYGELVGPVRVLGSIDDGGWRAFKPVTEDFLLAPDGTFVGE